MDSVQLDYWTETCKGKPGNTEMEKYAQAMHVDHKLCS